MQRYPKHPIGPWKRSHGAFAISEPSHLFERKRSSVLHSARTVFDIEAECWLIETISNFRSTYGGVGQKSCEALAKCTNTFLYWRTFIDAPHIFNIFKCMFEAQIKLYIGKFCDGIYYEEMLNLELVNIRPI